jgi:hypothetical protein
MMDSLQEILGKKDFTPPDEIGAIKTYIKRRYNSRCMVKIDRNAVIVTVPSPSLAATIHLERQSMIVSCSIQKRLVLRSGR